MIVVQQREQGTEYLVDWESYSPEQNSWVSSKDIMDPQLIKDFLREHPQRYQLMSRGCCHGPVVLSTWLFWVTFLFPVVFWNLFLFSSPCPVKFSSLLYDCFHSLMCFSSVYPLLVHLNRIFLSSCARSSRQFHVSTQALFFQVNPLVYDSVCSLVSRFSLENWYLNLFFLDSQFWPVFD